MAAWPDGALAGHRARALDLRRGARHGRRVRARLVVQPRPTAPSEDAVLPRPHAGNNMTPSPFPAEVAARAGTHRRRRPRLLGAQPHPQPERSRRGRRAVDLRPRPGAARHVRPALPDGARHALVRGSDRGSRSRRRRDRHTGIDALSACARGAPRRQARVHREAARRVGRAGGGARSAGGGARPDADAGPHLPLQPAGEHHPRPDHQRRARRHLLHLDEPREPRIAPVRRQCRVGSRPARFLDPSLLARGDAVPRRGDEPQLHLPEHPRRRFHQPRVRTGCHRTRRALVARAEQAAANDDRRLTEDGRLRRRQQRAGAHLRLGRDGRRSAVVR